MNAREITWAKQVAAQNELSVRGVRSTSSGELALYCYDKLHNKYYSFSTPEMLSQHLRFNVQVIDVLSEQGRL